MILADLQLTRVLRAAGAGRGPLPLPPPSGRYPLPDGAASSARRAALRAGHPGQVADRLVTVLESLRPWEREHVLDPLRRRAVAPEQRRDVAGGPDLTVGRPVGQGQGSAPGRPDLRFPEPLVLGRARAVQVDETTCGSAVLAVLAAAGDPVVSSWLVTGTDVSRGACEQVVSEGQADATARELETSSGRFQALQRLLKARTTRAALGPFPWPGGLGTPPWTAARDARYADVRFTHRIVAGGGPDDPVLAGALRAAAAGVPVPLYTGGDVGTGWSTAVPRHVVLLAGVSGPQEATRTDRGTAAHGGRWCSLYEPSSGALHRVRVADLLAGTRVAGEPSKAVRRALGGWPHVTWAVLPAGRAGGSRRVG